MSVVKPYEKVGWNDHVQVPENTFRQVVNADGTITQTRVGEVIQQGTPQSATNFNHMDNALYDHINFEGNPHNAKPEDIALVDGGEGPIVTLERTTGGVEMPVAVKPVAIFTGTGEISPDNRYVLDGVTGAVLRRNNANLLGSADFTHTKPDTRTRNIQIGRRVPAGTYAFSLDISGVGGGITAFQFSAQTNDGSQKGPTMTIPLVEGRQTVRFTMSFTFDRIYIFIPDSAPDGATVRTSNIQLTLGSEDKPFVARVYEDYEIPFGREVIGFAHAPAEVRMDGKPSKSTGQRVTFNGTEGWTLSGSTGVDGVKLFIRTMPGAKRYGASTIGDGMLCDAYKAVHPSALNLIEVNQCMIRTAADGLSTSVYIAALYETVDEFRAALAAAPITVFYELETPDEFILDPVTIVSLAGVNHVYSDVGDVKVERVSMADFITDMIDVRNELNELLAAAGGA